MPRHIDKLMVSVPGTYKGWDGGECVGEFQEVECGCVATSLFCVCDLESHGEGWLVNFSTTHKF